LQGNRYCSIEEIPSARAKRRDVLADVWVSHRRAPEALDPVEVDDPASAQRTRAADMRLTHGLRRGRFPHMSATAHTVRSREAAQSRPATPKPVLAPTISRVARDPESVLRLQRAAGNRATMSALNLSRCSAGCGCGKCSAELEEEPGQRQWR
jgi:hypothetical protein